MSILHEIGYYEEGELAPSPSDDDEPEVLTEKHPFPIGSGNIISSRIFVCREGGELTPDDDEPEVHRSNLVHHISRRRFVRREACKESLSTMKETELRLRILALTANRNRNLLK
jgi:hypothetical protein